MTMARYQLVLAAFRCFRLSFSSVASSSAPASPTAMIIQSDYRSQAEKVALPFKEWFKSGRGMLFDQIYSILNSRDDDNPISRKETDRALAQLGFRLSEAFVLEALSRGKDVLSCLKFFDWAGRQIGFFHTRATFTRIFRIMSREKLMDFMLQFLQDYMKDRQVYQIKLNNILVIGYAVAGKIQTALQIFSRMRFHGLDLDASSYNVLLNALVEEHYFEVVPVICKQISIRGCENEITRAILVKSFCKQNQLDEAESYFRKLVSNGNGLSGYAICHLVDALCRNGEFEKAKSFLEEFNAFMPIDHAYSTYMRGLIQAGKVDGALEFFHTRRVHEGFVPDVFRYNMLICKLLKEDRLEEVLELLMDMKENNITPDNVTMNVVLCLFCKAGMVNVAIELYNSRSEFGLTPNGMAYNYLINTLCCDGSIDQAYRVLKTSIGHGHLPRKKTFILMADALCRVGKVEKMKELIMVALEENFMPSKIIYDKFISALCYAGRIKDAYMIHLELSQISTATSDKTYQNLIYGFYNLSRGDMAAKLLLDMEEKGYVPGTKLFRAVISGICNMVDSEQQFHSLLVIYLSRHGQKVFVYNKFIDGLGQTKRFDLARQVYDMLEQNGIEPNMETNILMLKVYVTADKISDAVKFFYRCSDGVNAYRKLCNTMIYGLCRSGRLDVAMSFLNDMRKRDVIPGIKCFEELVMLLCWHQNYNEVLKLLDDLERNKIPISSFIGNVLLLHSLKGLWLYKTWVRSEALNKGPPCRNPLLKELIYAFSFHEGMSPSIEQLEELVCRCFQPSIYTYNMLLRKLSICNMDLACALFDSLEKKGYEPNQWSYMVIINGFIKQHNQIEADKWIAKMSCKGFCHTSSAKSFG